MRKYCELILLLFLAPAWSGIHADGGTPLSESRLCEVLENTGPGDRIPILMSGVFVSGMEVAMFYDPETITCSMDIQPSTWVEFAPSVQTLSPENYGYLNRILDDSNRAHVTFLGEFHGPGRIKEDDMSLPVMLSFANRISFTRYGHLGMFRTKLLVERILNVESVPVSVPYGLISRPASPATLPVVTFSAVPEYPSKAARAGIEGSVVVDIRVKNGVAVKATVESGERMLREATLNNLYSWRFQPDIKRRLKTTFIYRLELRPAGSSREPQIILELPEKVTIIGAANGW